MYQYLSRRLCIIITTRLQKRSEQCSPVGMGPWGRQCLTLIFQYQDSTLIAFAERHSKLVARKSRDFSQKNRKQPGLLKERSCPGYERYKTRDSFFDQYEMTVGPRDL